jgi:hypothetical protein
VVGWLCRASDASAGAGAALVNVHGIDLFPVVESSAVSDD